MSGHDINIHARELDDTSSTRNVMKIQSPKNNAPGLNSTQLNRMCQLTLEKTPITLNNLQFYTTPTISFIKNFNKCSNIFRFKIHKFMPSQNRRIAFQASAMQTDKLVSGVQMVDMIQN